MLSGRTARAGVGIVIAVSVAGALFHIATAPEHSRERREIARSGCMAAGGKWITLAKSEFCRRAEVEQRL